MDAVKSVSRQIQLTAEFQASQKEVARLRAALEALKRGTCWCEMAIGNPNAKSHSKGCLLASEALAKP